jgi:hypothetical protein
MREGAEMTMTKAAQDIVPGDLVWTWKDPGDVRTVSTVTGSGPSPTSQGWWRINVDLFGHSFECSPRHLIPIAEEAR